MYVNTNVHTDVLLFMHTPPLSTSKVHNNYDDEADDDDDDDRNDDLPIIVYVCDVCMCVLCVNGVLYTYMISDSES